MGQTLKRNGNTKGTRNRLNTLQFHNYEILDEQIDRTTEIEMYTLVHGRKPDL